MDFIVGSGFFVRFGFDDCADVGPLMSLFPGIFRVVSNKQSDVICGREILCLGMFS